MVAVRNNGEYFETKVEEGVLEWIHKDMQK
jgi:hypothetical protein